MLSSTKNRSMAFSYIAPLPLFADGLRKSDLATHMLRHEDREGYFDSVCVGRLIMHLRCHCSPCWCGTEARMTGSAAPEGAIQDCRPGRGR